MKDEIKAGDYIRTYDGIIGKVLEDEDIVEDGVYIDTTFLNDYADETNFAKYEDIVKHSSNIIELIGKNDIVLLEYYVKKYGKRISRKFEIEHIIDNEVIYFDNKHCSFCYNLKENKWRDGKGYNPKIKSIVTREQFENIEYLI